MTYSQCAWKDCFKFWLQMLITYSNIKILQWNFFCEFLDISCNESWCQGWPCPPQLPPRNPSGTPKASQFNPQSKFGQWNYINLLHQQNFISIFFSQDIRWANYIRILHQKTLSEHIICMFHHNISTVAVFLSQTWAQPTACTLYIYCFLFQIKLKQS